MLHKMPRNWLNFDQNLSAKVRYLRGKKVFLTGYSFIGKHGTYRQVLINNYEQIANESNLEEKPPEANITQKS